jgi:adenine deaminase
MEKNISIEDFINKIPKAELHLHIEGTFEPELMFKIAHRNKIKIKHESVEKLKAAYNFNNLQEFLDIYYEGAGVLINEKDFYDMTWSYLEKAHSQNVLHCEISFDPQTHTNRGIAFDVVIKGIRKALIDAQEKYGLSSKLIMCFLRDLDAESAKRTLEAAEPFKDWIAAVGLDSAEVGNPPSKFTGVFELARAKGFLTVAHAGEEGPAEYVKQALELLKVSRIDHGNNSMDDENIVMKLVEQKIPLTVCPLSNLKLKVVEDMKTHPLKKMMDKGLFVTVNSDDPAYFGGHVNENFSAVANALNLSEKDIYQLAKNSFEASFIDNEQKKVLINRLDSFCAPFL